LIFRDAAIAAAAFAAAASAAAAEDMLSPPPLMPPPPWLLAGFRHDAEGRDDTLRCFAAAAIAMPY